jgi:hypothetical protein
VSTWQCQFGCGDDPTAKQITSGLVAELGFEVVDAGELNLARLLDPYALTWIHLACRRGFGPGFGFGLRAAGITDSESPSKPLGRLHPRKGH